MTNVTDVHTCSISGMDLIIPHVSIMGHQLLKLARDMVHVTGISVPVGVNAIGSSHCPCILIIWCEIFIKSMPTCPFLPQS
jgi:hypothetical protein